LNALGRGQGFIEQVFVDWINAKSQYALILIPLFAFLEACVGVGLLVSGVFLLAVATVVFASQLASIETIVLLAFTGAVLGDHLGFYLGRWVGPRFHHSLLANKYRGSIERAEVLIRRYGSAAIFIGRFIPAIRSMIPAMLGISGFKRLRYLFFDVLACLLWAIALGAIVMGLDIGFSFSK